MTFIAKWVGTHMFGKASTAPLRAIKLFVKYKSKYCPRNIYNTDFIKT